MQHPHWHRPLWAWQNCTIWKCPIGKGEFERFGLKILEGERGCAECQSRLQVDDRYCSSMMVVMMIDEIDDDCVARVGDAQAAAAGQHSCLHA